MSNFFAPDQVYKERIAFCKQCEFYFKPTGNCKMCGCFMKIKARISMMDCPKKYWKAFDYKNTKEKAVKEIPQAIIEEVIELYPSFRTGKADGTETKRRMITLYNTIFNGHYNVKTNCSSCLSVVWKSLSEIYNKHK